MDLSYSPDEERFRAELRAWLTEHHPGPEPEELEAWVRFGKDWQRRLFEGGWCGLAWPREYGGRGASLIEQVIFQEEMARARAPMPINLAGLTMAGPVLIAHGTAEQKERHLRPILTGEEVWCQGFSEPNAGSDLAAIETRAVLDGDSFVVSGQKVWTSFARYSRWCMLLARTDPEARKHRGITFLIVDMESPGVTVRPLRQITGEEDFNEIFLDEVRVPRGNVVGEINAGWDIAITTLMHERTTLTFTRQLQSRRALDELLETARRWPSEEAPVAKDPLVRQRLAQAYIDNEVMRYTAYRNLTRLLRGGQPGPEGSMEKLFWSEMYQDMLESAVAILGPWGQLLPGEPRAVAGGEFAHLMLYSRGRTIAAGTSEIQRNILAERVLGLPRG